MSHSGRMVSADFGKGFILALIATLAGYYPTLLKNWVNTAGMNPFPDILACITFGWFFFFTGITIPFFVSKKLNEGNSTLDIIKIILARTLILLVTGILLANTGRVNADLTGIPSVLWSVLLVIAIFLVWNRYSDREKNFFTVSGLRITGLAILVFLVLKFRSGSYENDGSLIPGYWELPGLAGWGFLVSSLTWLALRNSITGTIIIWAFFLSLNILAALGMNPYLNPARPYAGILVDGFIPTLVLAGHIAGIIIKKHSLSEIKKAFLPAAVVSVIIIAAGIFLLKYFPAGRSFGNPAFSLIASGSAFLVFILLFVLFDIRNISPGANMFKTTGQNFFTAYMVFILISVILQATGACSALYSNSVSLLLRVAVAIVISLTVMLLTSLLKRTGIRLKF